MKTLFESSCMYLNSECGGEYCARFIETFLVGTLHKHNETNPFNYLFNFFV